VVSRSERDVFICRPILDAGGVAIDGYTVCHMESAVQEIGASETNRTVRRAVNR
jgi:hypothetical protein